MKLPKYLHLNIFGQRITTIYISLPPWIHGHAPLLLGVCSVVRMFKPKECGGEGKFKLIEEFAKNTKLKVMLSCGQ